MGFIMFTSHLNYSRYKHITAAATTITHILHFSTSSTFVFPPNPKAHISHTETSFELPRHQSFEGTQLELT
jgi:hypothetical protein